MGVYWDPVLNQVHGEERFISYPYSPVKVIIIPTNEEVIIAPDVLEITNSCTSLV